MSMAQFLALVVGAFGLAARRLGRYGPTVTVVLSARQAPRVAGRRGRALLGLLLAGALMPRVASAQSPSSSSVSAEAQATPANPSDAGSSRSLALSEEEPAPESLRAMAHRMLLDLGLGAGHRLRVGRLTMVYEDPVTEAQAVALGEFLSHSEVGDRGTSAGSSSRYGQVQVQLRQSSASSASSPSPPATYEVSIATQFAHRQELDPETKAAYQLMGLLASGLAFDGAPVHIHICTALLRPLLVLRPQLAAATGAGAPAATPEP